MDVVSCVWLVLFGRVGDAWGVAAVEIIAGISSSWTRFMRLVTSSSTTSSSRASWISIREESSRNTSWTCLGGAKSALDTTAASSAIWRFSLTGRWSRSRSPLYSVCTNALSMGASFCLMEPAKLVTAAVDVWDVARCSHSSTWRRMLRSLLIASWVSESLSRIAMCNSNWASKSA